MLYCHIVLVLIIIITRKSCKIVYRIPAPSDVAVLDVSKMKTPHENSKMKIALSALL